MPMLPIATAVDIGGVKIGSGLIGANDGSISVDPTRLPLASTSSPGLVQLATEAEIRSGNDSSKAVTPAGAHAVYAPLENPTFLGKPRMAADQTINTPEPQELVTKKYLDSYAVDPTKLPWASTSSRGVVQLATDAEIRNGNDSSKAVTPAGAHAMYAPLESPTFSGKPRMFTDQTISLPDSQELVTQKYVASLMGSGAAQCLFGNVVAALTFSYLPIIAWIIPNNAVLTNDRIKVDSIYVPNLSGNLNLMYKSPSGSDSVPIGNITYYPGQGKWLTDLAPSTWHIAAGGILWLRDAANGAPGFLSISISLQS